MVQKIDPLLIAIQAKDQSGKAFSSLKKNLTSTEGLAKIAGGALLAAGAASATAFAGLVVAGRETTLQLRTMGSVLNTTTREADALFSVLREGNPAANIEGLTDGLLTLQERFSEGRVGSGELFAFVKDFGLEANFAISGARNQTIEFLKVLRQLPDSGDRATTAIAVMGDEGARQFLPIINDVDLINQRIIELSGSIDELPDVFTKQDSENIDLYVSATGRLSKAFDELATESFTAVTPVLTAFTDFAAGWLEDADEVLEGAKSIANQGIGESFRRLRNGQSPNAPSVRSPDQIINGRRANVVTEAAAPAAVTASLKSSNTKLTAEQALQRRELAELHKRQEAFDQLQERALLIQLAEEGKNGGLNAPTSRFNQSEIDPIDDSVKRDADGFVILQEEALSTQDQVINTAGSFGVLGNAIKDFSSGAVKDGSKAFKAFQALQLAAATASAYSAASQALADFSSLSTIQKIGSAASVLAIGLGYVSKIKSLSGSGGGGGGSAPSAPSVSSQLPQAVNVPEATSSSRSSVNINVQGGFLSVQQLQEIGDRLAEIPGQPFLKISEAV